jgi:hypothetical protein
MFRFRLAVLVGLLAAAPASAGSWADGLFDELSKDFGSVPRGPTLTHLFRLTNNTNSTIHIASMRVSCGCTSANAMQAELAPGQSTAIQAQMDTRRFTGAKSVTIYVQFDRPSWEEVRLWVQANAHDDLSLTPEALNLGKAKRGTAPSGATTVTFLGNPGWQVLEVQRESNYVVTNLQELRRQGTEVSYQLTATIRSDAPVGKWFSDLWLRTNNPAMPRVRVPLTVEIEAPLTVSPTTVVLGQLKAGTESERRVIVRGVKPFRITAVKGTDGDLSVKDSTEEAKPIHVLTVRLKATKAGELSKLLRVVTDLKDEGEVEFEARAQIVP